jgi:pimeloyl-ACP methyl ester carboxylesterase
VTIDDGQRIAVRIVPGPSSRLPVILLHATLSSSAQLLPLARRLGETTSVILVDRRGSGASRMADPRPVPVGRHVADVMAILDDLGLARVVLVGHSFGSVVALEVAARYPDRIAAVLAWEPPYLPVADEVARAALDAVADRVAEAYAEGGSEAAARTFLGIVAGPAAWDRLHPRQRAAIAEGGRGALADVSMEGLEPDGLARIVAPTVLATGSASEPFYAPIADALADRIGPATRIDLDGLRHPAPITDPARIADLVIDLLERAAGATEPAQ